jgi:hypothetical protein
MCPKCGIDNRCPCKNCVKRRGTNGREWIWMPDGEQIRCWNCGHTDHADAWLDHDWDDLKLGLTLGIFTHD